MYSEKTSMLVLQRVSQQKYNFVNKTIEIAIPFTESDILEWNHIHKPISTNNEFKQRTYPSLTSNITGVYVKITQSWFVLCDIYPSVWISNKACRLRIVEKHEWSWVMLTGDKSFNNSYCPLTRFVPCV